MLSYFLHTDDKHEGDMLTNAGECDSDEWLGLSNEDWDDESNQSDQSEDDGHDEKRPRLARALPGSSDFRTPSGLRGWLQNSQNQQGRQEGNDDHSTMASVGVSEAEGPVEPPAATPS